MRTAVIVGGARTPMGGFGGALKTVPASDLAALAIRAALERSNVNPRDVGEVIFGNVLQAEQAGYAPRIASLNAGIPEETPVIAINRQCSSGIEAINLAALLIQTGEIDIAVAGGTESMSQSPYLLDYKSRFDGLGLGKAQLRDSLLDVLTCPVNNYHMGVATENLSRKYGISRSEQDELALLSHQRAVTAIKSGKFHDQIVPVAVQIPRKDSINICTDQGPREDTSIEKLSILPAVFEKGGTITAGNSSSINDGAGAVVMIEEQKASEMRLTPKLRWRARGIAGVDPAFFGTGPVPAVRNALKKASMSMNNIDLIELNEAFAAQAVHNIRELGLDIEKTNVNGSGISLGHPVGATGAVMTVKLMEEMVRTDQEVGLVAMCVGGGMGVATIFDRVA